MKRIIVEVDEADAMKWETASRAKRAEIAVLINKALEQEGKENDVQQKLVQPGFKTIDTDSAEHKKNVKEYLEYLDKIGAVAAENGLTEEILNKLLEEDRDDS